MINQEQSPSRFTHIEVVRRDRWFVLVDGKIAGLEAGYVGIQEAKDAARRIAEGTDD